MNNSFRGNKFGGPKKFNGGGGNFRKPNYGGGGSFERKEMFTVTCSECGKDAQVPFKPNGRKPVLCSNCFQKERGGENSDRGNSDRGNRQESRSYGDRNERPNYGDRPRFERQDKPAYQAPATQVTSYKQDFQALNYKLDKILKLLSPETSAPVEREHVSVEEEVAEIMAEITKAPAVKKAPVAKKTAAKEVVVKKAAPKKAAAKKAPAKKTVKKAE